LKTITLKSTTGITSLRKLNFFTLVGELLVEFKKVSVEFYNLLTILILDANDQLDNAIIFYILKLILEMQGIRQVVDRDVKTGSKSNIASFSLREGGLLSMDSIDKEIKLDQKFLMKIISLFNAKSLTDINGLSFNPMEEKILKEMFLDYYVDILGLPAYLLKLL
jgi:recombinational DNA repair protein (RecF pathway)